MGYVPLNNYKYDSGYKRIQSGPDHEGYVVLYSGVQSTGADDGIVVAGTPLSGTLASGAWGYDANWRYVPSTLPSQSGALDPTPYNASGALDTYDGVRISTRNTVAGAQIASAIGPETGKVNPRGAALQPNSNVTQPEKYMYFGGAAPDNQNYSPYNTPDANSAAEGKTGGGVTHRTFESSLLTNVLGSQGTSDRSQWRYHQPVYCKTYTETRRSEVPGLMSTPLRAVYRGGSTSYNYNYGGELLASRGGVGGGGGLYAEPEGGGGGGATPVTYPWPPGMAWPTGTWSPSGGNNWLFLITARVANFVTPNGALICDQFINFDDTGTGLNTGPGEVAWYEPPLTGQGPCDNAFADAFIYVNQIAQIGIIPPGGVTTFLRTGGLTSGVIITTVSPLNPSAPDIEPFPGPAEYYLRFLT